MAAYLRGSAVAAQPFVIFSRDVDAVVEQGLHRYYADNDLTVTEIIVSAGTAPIGADLVVDVLNSGTSLWDSTPAKPKVADGAHEGSVDVIDHPDVAAGEYLTVDILQIGSTIPGAKIDVRILYR